MVANTGLDRTWWGIECEKKSKAVSDSGGLKLKRAIYITENFQLSRKSWVGLLYI